jgi:hypothetical protein
MKVFKTNSIGEFMSRIEQKDLEVTFEIYQKIINAHKRNFKKVTVFDLLMPDGFIFGFEINRNEWKTALNTCITVLAENDMFEECIQAKKVLDSLNQEANETGGK